MVGHPDAIDDELVPPNLSGDLELKPYYSNLMANNRFLTFGILSKSNNLELNENQKIALHTVFRAAQKAMYRKTGKFLKTVSLNHILLTTERPFLL